MRIVIVALFLGPTLARRWADATRDTSAPAPSGIALDSTAGACVTLAFERFEDAETSWKLAGTAKLRRPLTDCCAWPYLAVIAPRVIGHHVVDATGKGPGESVSFKFDVPDDWLDGAAPARRLTVRCASSRFH